jgi:nucleoside-diphosphate-sugar epimerase
MYAVVTGVAGFIGSHLADELLTRGHRVLGIDCFTDYYDPRAKRENLSQLARASRFELVEMDLRSAPLEALLAGADTVFHQAAQPGVRTSFAGFAEYCEQNVIVTQRLLEAAKSRKTPRFVFASSSSVYGNALTYPTNEYDLLRPFSPYGVTKIAAEHLCNLYAANWGISTVSLRYFTVYGPRQRPDMALYKLIDSALHDRPFQLYGSGQQVRDFTYVSDVIQANIAAAGADLAPGSVLNIAGGSSVKMLDVIELVGELIGRQVILEHLSTQPGDVRRTAASTEHACAALGWNPSVPLRAGVEAQVRWETRATART